MIKILFVCHGNICRSPMGQYILKDMVEKKGLTSQFQIDSAATTTEEIWNGVGNTIYPPAQKCLTKHGIPFSKEERARLLLASDYDKYDYILGMDDENRRDMRRILGNDPEGKVKLILDYTDHPRSVADPWYTRNFEITYDDLVEGCTAFLDAIL